MPAKKNLPPNRRNRRRLRFQQILFVAFALLVVASFVISLFTNP